MPADSQKNVDYAFGRIESILDVIKQTLSEDRLASAQYRTEVRKELREQREQMHAIEIMTRQNAADIAEMKPKMNHLEERALKEEGAFSFAAWLVKAVPALLGAGAGFLASFLPNWIHK